MIQFCAMGGYEGLLRAEKKFYITLMGGCELKYPTLARRILMYKDRAVDANAKQWHFFLTIMGGVDISVPTLAEEFLDLRELIRTGGVTTQQCDQIVPQMGRNDLAISSFTLMGGLSEYSLPSDDAEVDSLAMQRHLGNIPEGAGRILQLGVGQRDAERLATIRRAVAAAS